MKVLRRCWGFEAATGLCIAGVRERLTRVGGLEDMFGVLDWVGFGYEMGECGRIDTRVLCDEEVSALRLHVCYHVIGERLWKEARQVGRMLVRGGGKEGARGSNRVVWVVGWRWRWRCSSVDTWVHD